MELALNLVWLVLAAGLLIFCAAHALSFPEKHRLATAAFALACVICLLFPVISMTDDLNSAPAVFETCNAEKFALTAATAVALLASLPVAPPLRHITWHEIDLSAGVFFHSREFFYSNLSRRPPPLRSWQQSRILPA